MRAMTFRRALSLLTAGTAAGLVSFRIWLPQRSEAGVIGAVHPGPISHVEPVRGCRDPFSQAVDAGAPLR
jgi:hypothetical protein